MKMTDFRALCEELFVKLKEWDSSDPYHDCGPLLCRARAALAEDPVAPSLKELALAILDDCSDRLDGAHENTIRRALEALPND